MTKWKTSSAMYHFHGESSYNTFCLVLTGFFPSLTPGNRVPSIILISPIGRIITNSYRSILTKMQRDAHLIYALNTTQLLALLSSDTVRSSIAGFVVTDASIMEFDCDCGSPSLNTTCQCSNPSLSSVVRSLLEDQSPNSDQHRDVNGKRNWTVVFAFDFPGEASQHPLRFGRFMHNLFGVRWKICGTTKGKVTLDIEEKALPKMGVRVYRGNKYALRGVFLEGVDAEDKVLRVAKGANARNGGLGMQGQVVFNKEGESEAKGAGGNCVVDDNSEGKTETDSTAGEEGEYAIEQVEVGQGGSPEGWTLAPSVDAAAATASWENDNIDMVDPDLSREESDWADDELTSTENELEPDENHDSDGDGDASSDDTDADTIARLNQRVIYINAPNCRSQTQLTLTQKPKPTRLADCPVAIHALKPSQPTAQSGNRVQMHGYVGFVGHVEDNRSIASLILGMCGVRNTRPLPANMQEYLRANQLV
ncbi:hypothetical protein BJX99DRAFT_199049 [Aspergillus californicus]